MNKVNIQCLYKIFEHSPIGIIIWCFEEPDNPADAHLKYCNKAAEMNINYKLRDHIGKNLQQIFPDAVNAEVTRSFVRALKTGVMQHLKQYKYSDKNVSESCFDVTVQALNHHLVMVSYMNVGPKKKSFVYQSRSTRKSVSTSKTAV